MIRTRGGLTSYVGYGALTLVLMYILFLYNATKTNLNTCEENGTKLKDDKQELLSHLSVAQEHTKRLTLSAADNKESLDKCSAARREIERVQQDCIKESNGIRGQLKSKENEFSDAQKEGRQCIEQLREKSEDCEKIHAKSLEEYQKLQQEKQTMENNLRDELAKKASKIQQLKLDLNNLQKSQEQANLQQSAQQSQQKIAQPQQQQQQQQLVQQQPQQVVQQQPQQVVQQQPQQQQLQNAGNAIVQNIANQPFVPPNNNGAANQQSILQGNVLPVVANKLPLLNSNNNFQPQQNVDSNNALNNQRVTLPVQPQLNVNNVAEPAKPVARVQAGAQAGVQAGVQAGAQAGAQAGGVAAYSEATKSGILNSIIKRSAEGGNGPSDNKDADSLLAGVIGHNPLQVDAERYNGEANIQDVDHIPARYNPGGDADAQGDGGVTPTVDNKPQQPLALQPLQGNEADLDKNNNNNNNNKLALWDS